MQRREFIRLIGGMAACWPLTAGAQQSNRVRRIGILVAEAIEGDPYYEGRLAAIKEKLRQLGWIEGQNLKLDIHRATPKTAVIRKHVEELLAGRPDIVITSGGSTTAPMLQATTTVPVVFMAAVDPVGAGLVESLSHPGGNATGFMQFDYSLSGKWLEILKQVSPTVTRAGIIRDAAINSGVGQFAVIQSVAGSVGIEVVPIGSRDEREIENGITKITRFPNPGLIVTSGALVSGHRDFILKLAGQHGLPAVYAHRIWVDLGGLISYGPDLLATSRLAAGYVDRILRGEKPADLPVQAPTNYELVVNLKTAKAMDITIPPPLLARADEVIE
jgi:putative tryptophan/tyrosine transport system substrate-binding protein